MKPITQGIYKITFPNGKSYIGQSCNLKRRLSDYKHLRCKKQPAIYKALLEFGVDSVTIDIVEQFETDEDLTSKLNVLEIKYIKEYNTLYPNGYNLTTGGDKFTQAQDVRISAKVSKLKKYYDCYIYYLENLEVIDKQGKLYTNLIECYKENCDSLSFDFVYDVLMNIGEYRFTRKDVPIMFGDYILSREDIPMINKWISFCEEALLIGESKNYNKDVINSFKQNLQLYKIYLKELETHTLINSGDPKFQN